MRGTASRPPLSDPLADATHFYSPSAMPKKGDPVTGKDVGGGLERVPEVKKNRKPIEND